MSKLKRLFATSVACVIGIALTACGGQLTLGLTGIQPPNITSQPVNQSVEAGQSATFSVAATGGTTLIYQWKKNGSNIPYATSSTYTIPDASSADNGARYSVSVSNSTGSVTSGEATLTVVVAPTSQPPTTQPPAITTQPASQSVVGGQRATFAVKAVGGGTLAYQWKKNGTALAGATSSSYTTPATSMADSGSVYSVVISNSAGAVTSNDATLTVTANLLAIAITSQPTARTITAGQTATFSVTATGAGTLSYQWKKGNTVIPGATNSSYTTPEMGYAANGAVYSVVVSNSTDSITSSSAGLTVNKKSTPKSYGLVANASDGLYAKEECVQDNHTGLVWEGKTASGTRAGGLLYTNYDDGNSAQNRVIGSTYANPTQTEIDASSNSIGYRNSVNASALCGFTDWRLPTKAELLGLVVSGTSPTIDTAWFPNTRAAYYWTSSPYAGYAYYAWVVGFSYGLDGGSYRFYDVHVRLVR